MAVSPVKRLNYCQYTSAISRVFGLQLQNCNRDVHCFFSSSLMKLKLMLANQQPPFLHSFYFPLKVKMSKSEISHSAQSYSAQPRSNQH